MLTRLTFRQLEYCLAAGEFGSVAKAAEYIHISPSSISAAITQVETELSVTLFIRRHAQGLSLTPAGVEVLKQIRLTLDQALSLYDIANNTQHLVRGPLRVGCFTPLAAMIAPELCQGFARAHPGAEVLQIEDHHEGLIERLRNAQIDVAITYDLNVAEIDIEFEALASLPPFVIVSETDPLAQNRITSLKALAQRPMILLDLPLSREYFLSLFREAGVSPTIAARSTSPDVLRSLVANGVGYSLANVRPRTNVSLDGKRLVSVNLKGRHRPMKLGLAWLKDQKLRSVVEAFMERCRACISDGHVPGMSAPGFAGRVADAAAPEHHDTAQSD
ncbi:LysR family transcriptional regulator [Neopusillimonas maritima]|uniref:LysR family transcriptional regulator n=1 Tax=Neopusillimonas maritima TaxID=2026239 RepID=A0A3A1YSK2_9BURK|nr:LysR family transcriptional regulator [Neopusillimonas maritima]RIY41213.1 LysR family transcriptional regulator [Neopusillimonas maritima]